MFEFDCEMSGKLHFALGMVISSIQSCLLGSQIHPHFSNMANGIFWDLLDIFLIIYLEDLLIYSKTQEEHDIHVQKVLERLRKYVLYAKLEKCNFDCKEVKFLGYTISSKGIFMDLVKVRTILE